jgi:hypothetical protein
MKAVGFRVIVRAYDKHGYQKDILVASDRQVQIQDARLSGGHLGTIIDPKLLPEMEKFEVIVETIYE